MKDWDKEKAYCEKRASELTSEMEAAIETSDRARFQKAFETAQRYMTRKQLNSLLKAFYERTVQK
jgi:hypothetical protein